MAVNWTKLWAPSDDGTVLRGVDIRNIQNDISSTGLTDADSIQGKDVAAPTAADDGHAMYWDNSADRYDYEAVEVLMKGNLGTIADDTPNQGDIIYDNGTDFQRLTPGTAGQQLQTGGAGANPSWADGPPSISTTIAVLRMASDWTWDVVSAGTATTDIFDTEDLDVGNNFNTTTKEYTVPADGYYSVSVTLPLQIDEAPNSIDRAPITCAIQCSNGNNLNFVSGQNSNQSVQRVFTGSGYVVYDLTSGDTINGYIHVQSLDGTQHFSGELKGGTTGARMVIQRIG